MGGSLNWEALEVTGEKRVTWRKTALRVKRLMTDGLWGPKERGEQMAGWQTWLTGE